MNLVFLRTAEMRFVLTSFAAAVHLMPALTSARSGVRAAAGVGFWKVYSRFPHSARLALTDAPASWLQIWDADAQHCSLLTFLFPKFCFSTEFLWVAT